MCGICGIVGWKDPEYARTSVAGMTAALRHRGPDGEGIWTADRYPLTFGHTRLAIIDLTDDAAQPFVSHDGRYVLTYNGEVYNYRELREECTKLGSRFTSHSDTEVILEAYRHWGVNAFSRFRGMWAFALFDTVGKQLILCRDPFGIKPLYYGFNESMLFFASEPKALRTADPCFAEIDETTVLLFEQFGYIERSDWTFFRKVSRFPQASYAVLKLDDDGIDSIRPVVYWHPPEKTVRIGEKEAAEELKRLLTRSVDLHLRSDVPVGSCLSGGIDSSAIVCIGSGLAKETGRFNTFTTTYPEHHALDETAWAHKVVDYTDALPHYTEPRMEEFLSDLDRLTYQQDEPFGSTSIYAQYSVFRLISGTRVKVILDGQGADEVFAGYHGLLGIFSSYLLAGGKILSFLTESSRIAQIQGKRLSSQYLEAVNFMKNRGRTRLQMLTSSMLPRSGLDEARQRLIVLHSLPSSFEQYLTEMVMKTNLPELLRYEDRNSMAFSIESRVPFLESDLVEFALALPADCKIRGGVTKYILREALKGIIPEEIRVRPDKLGFPAPEKEWLEKGFGMKVDGTGSMQWRCMAVKRWRTMLERNPSC